jgi:transposase
MSTLNNTNNTIERLFPKKDYAALERQAMILYIKDDIAITAICQRLKLSTSLVNGWVRAGKWDELKPGNVLETSTEHEKHALVHKQAAVLYIKHGMAVKTICQELKVSKSLVSGWVRAGGWNELKPGNKAAASKESEKYAALRKQAMVLYIKSGLSAEVICKQLNISQPTLQKWNKAGNWQELRPDMEVLNEYKAAALYIEQGMSTGEISQRLSVSELTVKIWVDLNGWNATRLAKNAPDMINDVLTAFNQHFNDLFPQNDLKVEFAIQDFIASNKPKKINQ